MKYIDQTDSEESIQKCLHCEKPVCHGACRGLSARPKRVDVEKLKELYKQGYNDVEIAGTLGVTREAIKYQREKNGLVRKRK